MANDRRTIWAMLKRWLGLSEDMQGLRSWEVLSILGYASGLGGIAIYALATPSFAFTFGLLALVGAAAWLSGGVLGFIFGVPRLRAASGAAGATTSVFVPNTNLEQISDWLTKIIVGATLVQMQPLAAGIGELAASIGGELRTRGATAVSGGVMILYFAGGFMWGYLWCSLRIFREMSALTDRETAVAHREAALARLAPAAVAPTQATISAS
jgi:hypothetical protein